MCYVKNLKISVVNEKGIEKKCIFPSDELSDFYDGHGSVSDYQHYIHPWIVKVPNSTYRLDGQVCLKSGVVNHFMDKKKVDNTKINKKRVNNTNFKTNLTVQAVGYF